MVVDFEPQDVPDDQRGTGFVTEVRREGARLTHHHLTSVP